MIKQWIIQGCVTICNSSWNIQSCAIMSWWTLHGTITVCTQSSIQGCVIIYNDKTSKATSPSATANGSSKCHLQHLHSSWTIKGCLILSWWTSQSYFTVISESSKATKPPTTNMRETETYTTQRDTQIQETIYIPGENILMNFGVPVTHYTLC